MAGRGLCPDSARCRARATARRRFDRAPAAPVGPRVAPLPRLQRLYLKSQTAPSRCPASGAASGRGWRGCGWRCSRHPSGGERAGTAADRTSRTAFAIMLSQLPAPGAQGDAEELRKRPAVRRAPSRADHRATHPRNRRFRSRACISSSRTRSERTNVAKCCSAKADWPASPVTCSGDPRPSVTAAAVRIHRVQGT